MLLIMRRGIAIVAIVLPVVFAAQLACAATNVELIVDDSGSMAQHVKGGRKIDVAKQVLPGLIHDLPSDAQIAVRTYGRQHPAHDRDCADMEMLTPFGANTSERVLPGVNSLKPNGMTPIAASLSAAAKDFAGKESQNNVIILLTDGEEDCNGDPCAASKALHYAGIHLQVNVIGFNVNDKARAQLQCIADAAAGKYYDAKDAAGLKLAASEVKEHIVATPAPATPSATPTPTELNLLSPAQGGQLLAAPNDNFRSVTTGNDKDLTGFSACGGVPFDLMYAFKDEKPATFSKFEMLIPNSGQWVKDFELFAADDSPTGSYRSLGKFSAANMRMMKTPYQEFPFTETTAKYFKVRVLSGFPGDCSNAMTQIRLIGKPAPDQPAAPAATPAPNELNLLSPAQGGQLLAAPNDNFRSVISGNDGDRTGFSACGGVPFDLMFAFKDEKPATFSKFEMLIPSSGQWVQDFELLAADDSPSGTYRSLGKFTVQNMRMIKSPYQEFPFAETTAKYLKVRILSGVHGDCSNAMTQIRLMGRPAPGQSATASSPAAAQSAETNLLSPAQGGQLLAGPDPNWKNLISGNDTDTTRFSACGSGVPTEGVFAFKDEKPARFSKFEILIPSSGQWVKDFELLAASDSPTGTYKSLGKFTTQNIRLIKSPYQEFTLPETTAKYLKVRILAGYPGDCNNSITQIRLIGKPAS